MVAISQEKNSIFSVKLTGHTSYLAFQECLFWMVGWAGMKYLHLGLGEKGITHDRDEFLLALSITCVMPLFQVTHAGISILGWTEPKSKLSYRLANYIKPTLIIQPIINIDCMCDQKGSNNTSCDKNGICNCLPNVIGVKCTECADNHWDFPHCKGTIVPYYI